MWEFKENSKCLRILSEPTLSVPQTMPNHILSVSAHEHDYSARSIEVAEEADRKFPVHAK